MGTIFKQRVSPRESKKTRAERRNDKRRLAGQVRRADRKGLSPWAHLIALLVIGR